MGFEATDYVYKITVDGTDIREYYDLEEKLPADKVKDIWLSDAKSNHGQYLAKVFAGRVNVELLTEEYEDSQSPRFEGEAIPLPPPPDGDNE